jgi:methionyl-tRNA synthetase
VKKFFITTAIPYVNAAPHIGHALEFVEADVIARFHRLMGEEVRFLTGTDDNALKNVQAAEGKNIPVADLVKTNSDKFLEIVKKLNVSIDDFIRTTEKRHVDGAQAFWLACQKEDIYKKKYQGLYCVGCEAFYLEKDLIDGKCPEHKKKPELIEEENYFFRLSNYQDWLYELIKSDELKIVPDFRKNEVLSFIKSGLEDFSISRSVRRAKGWGIPVPNDPEQIIYVWFDALTNYITALNWQNNDPLFVKFWPADVQVIGKGITRFHAIYWPAMLKSVGLLSPKEIFVHGYVTVEGEKISKSLGNVIDPLEYIEKYGVDAVRYYLLKEIPSFNDGDFSKARFIEVYNSELANNLGNLVSRVAKLAEGLVQQPFQWSIVNNNDPIAKQIKTAYAKYKFDEVIGIINREYVDYLNSELNRTTPWKLEVGSLERKEIMLRLISRLLEANAFLEPIIPDTTKKITKVFTGVIRPNEKSLFPRI